MERQQVIEIALASGLKLKEQPSGEMDLNPNIYAFVENILEKNEELSLLRNLHEMVRRVHRYHGIDYKKTKDYLSSMFSAMHCVNTFNDRNEDF